MAARCCSEQPHHGTGLHKDQQTQPDGVTECLSPSRTIRHEPASSSLLLTCVSSADHPVSDSAARKDDPEALLHSSNAAMERMYRSYIDYAGTEYLDSLCSALLPLGLSLRLECGHLLYCRSRNHCESDGGVEISKLSSNSALPLAPIPRCIRDLVKPYQSLILIRHGETMGNVLGVFQGRSDVHPLNTLTETGKQQAEAAADKLTRHLAGLPKRTYSQQSTPGHNLNLFYTEEQNVEKPTLIYNGKRIYTFSTPSSRGYDTAMSFVTKLLDSVMNDSSKTTSGRDHQRKVRDATTAESAQDGISSPGSVCRQGDGCIPGDICSPGCVRPSAPQHLSPLADQFIIKLTSLSEGGFGSLENRGGRGDTVNDLEFREMYKLQNAVAKPTGPIGDKIRTEDAMELPIDSRTKSLVDSADSRCAEQEMPSECFAEVALRAFNALREIRELVQSYESSYSAESISASATCSSQDVLEVNSDVIVVVFAHSLIGNALRILLRQPIPKDPDQREPEDTSSSTQSNLEDTNNPHNSKRQDEYNCGCSMEQVQKFSGNFKLPNCRPVFLWQQPGPT
eukprot:GHVQ01034694.1.p1 GENE.GHVQ01034694.1~~GHVQ01034694.1.p1  ORF type:complete len:567 (-),score=68.64 GHVQ01034694.1:261-1961(-)